MTAETLPEIDGWLEGGPCPMKIGNEPCSGVLTLQRVGSALDLVCSEQPVYHSKPLSSSVGNLSPNSPEQQSARIA